MLLRGCTAHLAMVSLVAMNQIHLLAIVQAAVLALVVESVEVFAAFGRAMVIVLAKT